VNNYFCETGDVKKIVNSIIKSRFTARKGRDILYSYVIFIQTDHVDVEFMPQKNMAFFKDSNDAQFFLKNALILENLEPKLTSESKKIINKIYMPPTFTNAPMFNSKRLNHIEKQIIPTQNVSIHKQHTVDNIVIGQFQQSFIVCVLRQLNADYLVIIDPHATDERIKLERLTKNYFNLLDTFSQADYLEEYIILPLCFYDIAKEYGMGFSKYGLKIDISSVDQSTIHIKVSVLKLLIPDIMNGTFKFKFSWFYQKISYQMFNLDPECGCKFGSC
jgi:DNA mismatch repair ATPase MutL